MLQNQYEKLLDITLRLLVSHSNLTKNNYNNDPSYNDDSLGMREEQNACEKIQEIEPNFLKKIQEMKIS